MPADEIETLSSRVVYRNRWMTVREDGVRFADGHESIYGYVGKPDFVLIVPIHTNGDIQLVEQFRYPLGRRLWELPQGGWPAERGAEPVAVAHGELAEETGLRARRMEPLCRLHQAAGVLAQGCDAFVATGLTEGRAALEPEEQGLITRAFPLPAILAMIAAGDVTDAPTIAALGYLRLIERI